MDTVTIKYIEHYAYKNAIKETFFFSVNMHYFRERGQINRDHPKKKDLYPLINLLFRADLNVLTISAMYRSLYFAIALNG